MPRKRSISRRRSPVAIVGAGPVGLCAALDCASRGLNVTLYERQASASGGSRAISYGRQCLETLHRLGCADSILAEASPWRNGRVFYRDRLSRRFTLEDGTPARLPVMVNLSQARVEDILLDRCRQLPARIDLRFEHTLTDLIQTPDGVKLNFAVDGESVAAEHDWLIACDGASSTVRNLLDVRLVGEQFPDYYLVADVELDTPLAEERWFWLDPAFNGHRPALLLHRGGDVWRADLQLGTDIDIEHESRRTTVESRLHDMLGEHTDFRVHWSSLYRFACRRIERFRINRVFFAGDAAHEFSPLGARGVNAGIQDVDNLGWKLAMACEGNGSETLLNSYHDERAQAADHHVTQSVRVMEFVSPRDSARRMMRDAALSLAGEFEFARELVNCGGTHLPVSYTATALNCRDESGFDYGPQPGDLCPDAPLDIDGEAVWLLDVLGPGFTVVYFGDKLRSRRLATRGISARIVCSTLPSTGSAVDLHGDPALVKLFDAAPGTTYLIRPDRYVAARWRHYDDAAIREALCRAAGLDSLPHYRMAG